MSLRCPICKKPTSSDYRPFCSKRCAHIDLAKWLGDHYLIKEDEDQKEKLEKEEADN